MSVETLAPRGSIEREIPAGRAWDEPPVLLALAAILVAVAYAVVLAGRPPGDASAEAGFARDMAVHHAQAVEMAEIARDGTRDSEIKILATDIALTQQAQIGQLQGWLGGWGLPIAGEGPAMAWMGQATAGPMPGMASRAEIAALRRLPPADMDAEFLRLMIPHHQGGVAMAEALIDESDNALVTRFARGVISAQSAEIEVMQSMLEARGFERVKGSISMSMPGMEHGEEEGFAAPLDDFATDAPGFVPIALGVFAAFWLAVDTFHRRRLAAGGRAADEPRTISRVAAIGGLALGGFAHIVLSPEHFAESLAYGLFFVAAAVALLFCAAALLARPSPAVYLAGAAISLMLIVVYVLFRLVPPPGAAQAEAFNIVGLVTKATEAIALVACVAMWHSAQAKGLIAGAARRVPAISPDQ